MAALVSNHPIIHPSAICGMTGTQSPTSGAVKKPEATKQKNFLWLNDLILGMDSGLLLRGEIEKSGSKDKAAYSHGWYLHQIKKEAFFAPWCPTLGAFGSTLEILRLKTIRCFWDVAIEYNANPVSIHLAVWLLNKLLQHHTQVRAGKISRDLWALTSALSLKMALKFEEKPEIIWGLPSIWKLFPIFDQWMIDRSDSHMISVESQCLRIINDRFDVPICTQLFEQFISVGGWPQDIKKDYLSLGYYLLALSTFASGEDHQLRNLPPSKLAAAATVLSVKIVNGDSSRSYEFYPAKLAAYTQYSLKELQQGVKGLSHLLRNKPEESSVIGKLYPTWGTHEWQ